MNRICAIVTAIVVTLTMTGLNAQEGIQGEKACKADRERLCGDIKPGKGAIARCLVQHEEELAPACKEKLTQLKEKRQSLIQACKEDKKKFCANVPVGQGKVLKCLKDNESQISEACKAELVKPTLE